MTSPAPSAGTRISSPVGTAGQPAVLRSALAGLGVYSPLPTQPGVPPIRGTACRGVSYRASAASGVSTPVLAAGAARAALAAAQVTPQAIGMVVVATTSPDVVWPTTASLVQHELGIPKVGSFDLGAAEAGLITALGIADRFLRSGLQAALVIGAESDNQLVDLPGQWVPRARVAGAAVLCRSQSGETGILATITGGAAAEPLAAPAQLERAIDRCLQDAGVHLTEVDLVIGEPARPEAMRAWARAQGVPEDRLVVDAARYATAITAAPLLALYDAVKDQRLRPGMVSLMISCGRGPAWSVACIRWGEGGISAR